MSILYTFWLGLFLMFTASPSTPTEPSVSDSSASLVEQTITGRCGYAPSRPQVKAYDTFIPLEGMSFGNPDAKVTMIEFYDPNCGHCKQAHPIMQAVQASYGSNARMAYVPFPIWNRSHNQTEALYEAAVQGKYLEMVDIQFKNQRRRGLSDRQLIDFAAEIGMDTDKLAKALVEGTHRKQMIKIRDMIDAAGVSSTPTIWINGKTVNTLNVDCIGSLILDEG